MAQNSNTQVHSLSTTSSATSSYPSFLFSGVNSSMKDLTEELNQLGGGSARISELEFDCVIDDRIHKDSYQILWPLGKSIGLRNAKLPKNHPVAESMRYFPVSSVNRYSSSDYSKTSIHHQQSRNVSQWVLDGFNASVICYGSNPTKTESIYGTDLSNRKESNFRKGFVYEVLQELFEKIQENTENVSTILSLSLWILKGNDVIDLCASTISSHHSTAGSAGPEDGDQRDKKNWLEFVSIECANYEIAVKIIDTARERAHHNLQPTKDRDKSHLFLRILLHRSPNSDVSRHKGSISHLHIVDLTSLSTAAGFDISQMEEEDRIARREMSLQLNSLCKVLIEIRDLSRAAQNSSKNRNPVTSYSQSKITSARDSKLTLILAPLIQGNTKTWFFLHVKDGEENYPTVLHTLASLEGIGEIQSACHHVKDIPLSSLRLKQPDTVLPPQYDTRPFKSRPPPPSGTRQYPQIESDNTNNQRKSKPLLETAPRSKSPVAVESSHPKEEIKLTNLLNSTEFDHLMDEFNSLMAQVEQKQPIRPTTPIHPAYSNHNSRNEYPMKSSLYEPSTGIFERPPSQSQERASSSSHTFPPSNDQYPENKETNSDSEEENIFYAHMNPTNSHRPINRYQQDQDFEYHSDHSNPSQPPSPRSTNHLYFRNTRENRRNRGDERQREVEKEENREIEEEEQEEEEDEEESDWERKISFHHRHDSAPPPPPAPLAPLPPNRQGSSFHQLRDSLETSVEVESLQQERNKRKDHYRPHHTRHDNDHDNNNGNEYPSSRAMQSSHPMNTNYNYNHHLNHFNDEDTPDDQNQSLRKDPNRLYGSYRQDPFRGKQVEVNQHKKDEHEIETENEEDPRQDDEDEEEVEEERSREKGRKVPHDQSHHDFYEHEDDNFSMNHNMPNKIGMNEMALINESLMASLQFEREAKEKLLSENRTLEEELLEARTTQDIQEEGHKVEILRLKSQIRKLLTEQSHDDILASFEEDLSRLMNENAALKQRNVYLEDLKEKRIGNSPLRGGTGGGAGTGAGAGAGTGGGGSSSDPGISWTASEGMVGGHGETSVSIREYRNLRTQYKKLEKQSMLLSQSYEELRKKERHYMLSIKQFEENQRRLKALHHENLEIKSQIEIERGLRVAAERDLQHLKDETVSLQFSERTIREERSRILSELSMSRQRVRELTDQAREIKSMNRFISKHSPSTASGGTGTTAASSFSSTSPSMSSTAGPRTPNRHHRTATKSDKESSYASRYFETPGNFSESSTKLHQSFTNSHLFHHHHPAPHSSTPSASAPPPPPDALSGVAGLSNAMYVREEEMEPMSLSLERSLLSLHDSIAITAPSLLPLIQKLGTELRNERTLSHRQKIELLSKYSNNSTRSTPSHGIDPSTPLQYNKHEKISSSSGGESRGRKTQQGTRNRSRSRSAGSIGDVSVNSHNSYRTNRSYESTSGAAGRSTSGGGSGGAKMIFFRRENDV